MTQETFFVTDLKDIHSVRINCLRCGASIALNPDKTVRVEPRCHQCGEDMMDGNTQGMITSFINYLRNVRGFKSDTVSVGVAFKKEVEPH
jgi:hypothetical protein